MGNTKEPGKAREDNLRPIRRHLPAIREGYTAKNEVGGLEFYVTVNFYEETFEPAELFVVAAKEGSTLGGVCDLLSIMISLNLQYGVPWETISRHCRNTRFAPSGISAITGETYTSLGEAIADTVDRVIYRRKSLWGEIAPERNANGSN